MSTMPEHDPNPDDLAGESVEPEHDLDADELES